MPPRNFGDRYDWRRLEHVQNFSHRPPQVLPVRFNSGPTPPDALRDLVVFIQENPDVWSQL